MGSTAAHAASISFDPEETTVGMNAPFQVGITLTADRPVNALSLVINVPPSLTPVDVSDGNSVINYWIGQPAYDAAAHTLTLTGIIPGGYTGIGGRVAVLKLKASVPGEVSVSFDPSLSKLYRDTAQSQEEPLTGEPIRLSVSPTKQVLSNTIPDTRPPEPFIPAVVKGVGMYDGAYVLTFATQDKGSGIDHYEIQESNTGLFSFLFGSSWKRAESPYPLSDQQLHSAVSVRAIDEQGNIRVETIPALYPLPWYEDASVSSILIAAALALGVALYRNRNRA